MSSRESQVDLSVIVPVGGRHADATEIYSEYKAGLDALEQAYELIFVLDGPHDKFSKSLRKLIADGQRVIVVSLTRSFGEATAVMAGFEYASGDVIITLPAHHQIEVGDISKLLRALDDCDLAVARRWPRTGGPFERLRRHLFHGLLAFVTGLRFHDLGCGARVLRRQVLKEVQLYGDQHRFIAVLADRQGFRVREIDVRQSPKDHFEGVYKIRAYARSLLDIFTVFFLVRFTKRPLRFFGTLGASTFVVGGLLITWMVIERLLFSQGLAERPALLLASLLMVLGMQLFALGLLGELIIFTHARGMKDYQVDRVIQFGTSARQA